MNKYRNIQFFIQRELRYLLLYRTLKVEEGVILKKNYDLEMLLEFGLSKGSLNKVLRFKEFLAYLFPCNSFSVQLNKRHLSFLGRAMSHNALYAFFSLIFYDFRKQPLEIFDQKNRSKMTSSFTMKIKDLNLGVKPAFEVPEDFYLLVTLKTTSPSVLAVILETIGNE